MAAPFLDRMLHSSNPLVTVSYNGADTIIDLPYALPDDGSEGVMVIMRDSPREIIPFESWDPGQLAVAGTNLIGIPFWVGVDYASFWQFSVIHKRDPQTDIPDLRGRLNLRYVKLHYENSTGFRVYVSAAGRPTRTYTFRSATPVSGIFNVPIQAQNTQVTITVSSSVPEAPGTPVAAGTSCSPFAASFSGYEWEGMFFNRVSGGR